jgi:hypothetical protein
MKNKILVASLILILSMSIVLASPMLTKATNTKAALKTTEMPKAFLNKIANAVKISALTCKGDVNLDGKVTFADIDAFTQTWVKYLGHTKADCWANAACWAADIDGNGVINQADVDPFVATLGTICSK